MSEITYNDWLWEQQIPIEDLSEEEKEDVMRIIDELSKIPLRNYERISNEQKTSKYSENLED